MRSEVSYFNTNTAEYRAEYERETPEGYSFRVRREKVLAMLPEGHGKRIMDLASGPGIMIKGLRAKGYDVACVDAAPDMIALAQIEAAGDPHVTCEVGDAYALPHADESFDVLTAMGLIEYLDGEDTFIKEAKRVVKPGGSIIITVPNIWSPWRMWNRALRLIVKIFKPHKATPLLHREYTKRGFIEQLERHGLKVESVVYYNFKLVPFPIDRVLPRFTVWQSKVFEALDRTPLKFLGTGFIAKATK